MLPTFNVPPLGPRQGKVWGHTQLAFAFNSTEAHVITPKKGSFCSQHRHCVKWNRFFVISGKLLVRMFLEDDMRDETIIGPNQGTDVPPGVYHQFEAVEDTIAVEFYWVPLDVQDIERRSQGGLR